MNLVRYLLIYLFFLCFNLLSCAEKATRSDVERQHDLSTDAHIQVIGGSILKVEKETWGIKERYEVEFALESMNAALSLVVYGCQPILVSFKARYHPSRYQAFLRSYEGILDTKITPEKTLQGILEYQNKQWSPTSSVLRLPVNEETENATQTQIGWSILVHAGSTQIIPSSELETVLSERQETLEELQQRCVRRRESTSTQEERTLIRQQISYQWESPLRVGVLRDPKGDSKTLHAQLQAAETLGIDALVLLGSLSDGNAERLTESRAVLAKTPLFWWALPGFDDLDLTSQWIKEVGALDFSLDIGSLRISFLDTTQLTLDETQLKHISRWINPTPLNPLDEASPHSSILFSIIPLVNSGSSNEKSLDYRVGAMRTFSAMRASLLTHHIVREELDVSETNLAYQTTYETTQQKDFFGAQVMQPPNKASRILELKLYPECSRDERETSCLEWSDIDLPLEVQ